MQKLLVEYPSTEDNDDGNGSESSATSLIYEEDVCHPRTDQSLIIPEISPLKQNVGIPCCIAAKTFANAETQTHDSNQTILSTLLLHVISIHHQPTIIY